ncbi:two-component system sensor histidine kinase VicK [Flavobacterium sp. W4I14]|nr:two-component system sensor histidine kinase VicK [Flavobacterium sp. W4I14]
MDETQAVLDKFKAYEERGAELKLEVAELRKLMRLLQSSDEKSAILSSIVESSDDAIISKDLNGIITSWNNSAQRIFGYSAEEMIGTPILKLIPFDRQHEEPKILAQLKNGIRVDHFETQRLRKDGSLIDVSLTISPIYNVSGAIIGISKIARDITLHRKAEVDGRRLMAIIESSDDAIISKDLNSVITSWNAAAERIFGYTAKEMIGESILKIIPVDRFEEEPKILAQLRQGVRVDHFETKRLRKDGTLINVSLTISPIKNWAGEVVGLSKIARDITDKKQAERKKEEFVSFVSHELKTPLTSLKSYIQIAQAKADNPDFLKKALNKAAQQSKKMENMISSFLHISRIEEGHIGIEKTSFDISALIAQIIEDGNVTDPRHHFSYHGETSLKALADRDKISMVLTNLVSNAQKYSPNGGNITISCHIKGEKIHISVKDEGIGISLSDQKHMFQKFYRVESELTRPIPGFGIGLYLASRIVELHDSSITLQSELGVGSTFAFDLELG